MESHLSDPEVILDSLCKEATLPYDDIYDYERRQGIRNSYRKTIIEDQNIYLYGQHVVVSKNRLEKQFRKGHF